MPGAPEKMLPGLDTYWRLQHPSSPTEDLRKHVELKIGRQLPDNITRLRLDKLLGRVERQALDYKTCTQEELQKFTFERKLVAQKDMMQPTEELIEILETGDEERTFRFLDLSPELRCRVYGYYLAALPQSLKAPAQPPLARTCKLVRTEIVPIFYRTVQFHFKMEQGLIFSYDTDTHQFLTKIHYKHWKMISNFSLDIGGRYYQMRLKTNEKGSEAAVFWEGQSLRAVDVIGGRIERYLLRVVREHAKGGKFSKFDMLILPENVKKAALLQQ